jgi:signal transduction histidine kinase
MQRWWKELWAFVLTVALVVAGFLATTAVILVRLDAAGEASIGITRNAVPSIEELTRAHAALSALHVKVGRHALNGGDHLDAEGHEAIFAAIAELRAPLARYVALPSYPGERELSPELLTSIDAVVATTHRLVAAPRDPAVRRPLLDRLDREVARAAELLWQSERINAEEVRYFTGKMEAIRGGSSQAALLLNGACVVLAAVLLRRAVRMARRQRDIEARYAAVLRQRADEMEVFAGRVAHDILSPLGSTALHLERLAAGDDAEVAHLAGRAQRGIDRVQATVDGLLEFARAGARPGDAASDAVEVTRDALAGLEDQATAAGVSLDLLTGEPALPVRASRGVLLSLVTNLVQNAIKYIGEASERRVAVRLVRRDARVRLEVKDSGPGIPPDLERRIFEPYFRVASTTAGVAGLGLGLATVRRLVEAHGGAVGLTSEPGAGTTFWVELPSA